MSPREEPLRTLSLMYPLTFLPRSLRPQTDIGQMPFRSSTFPSPMRLLLPTKRLRFPDVVLVEQA